MLLEVASGGSTRTFSPAAGIAPDAASTAATANGPTKLFDLPNTQRWVYPGRALVETRTCLGCVCAVAVISLQALLTHGGSMRYVRAGESIALMLALAATFAACGGSDNGAKSTAPSQILRVSVGPEPPSLDPGLATDVTSANVLSALMGPLVKLGDDLQPVPSLAESWEVSADRKTVTFRLRQD